MRCRTNPEVQFCRKGTCHEPYVAVDNEEKKKRSHRYAVMVLVVAQDADRPD